MDDGGINKALRGEAAAHAGPASSSLPRPSKADIDAFTRAYNAHLAQASGSTAAGPATAAGDEAIDATAELEAFRARIPSTQQPHLDAVAQHLRSAFHASQAHRRQERLCGLLAQMPPFRLSDRDFDKRTSAGAKRQRLAEMRTFAKTYATRTNVGVHPFFAALRQLLAAQALDARGWRLQWALDDAVLMEAGGDDFMQAAVWLLKGVLHFDEHDAATPNPFLEEEVERDGSSTNGIPNSAPIKHRAASDGTPQTRLWTVSPHLNNPECRALARCVPVSATLPRSISSRRAASSATRRGAPVRAEQLAELYADAADEERQPSSSLELATGALRVAPPAPDIRRPQDSREPARRGGSRSSGVSVPDKGHGAPREKGFRGTWTEWLIGCVYAILSRG